MSLDPTEIKDMPCVVCQVFYPEDELSIADMCYDCELENKEG
jgi:hypothetical protein